VGAVFIMHGYYAWAVLGPAAAAGLIARMGFPPATTLPLAWYLVLAHFAGGILITVGLWTRWAALANVPVMASAVFLLHLKQGFFLRPTGTAVAGYEYALVVLAATVALVLLGSGTASVDGARR
jgi:putative oxidoreductase